jgi:hypothetical protein
MLQLAEQLARHDALALRATCHEIARRLVRVAVGLHRG